MRTTLFFLFLTTSIYSQNPLSPKGTGLWHNLNPGEIEVIPDGDSVIIKTINLPNNQQWLTEYTQYEYWDGTGLGNIPSGVFGKVNPLDTTIHKYKSPDLDSFIVRKRVDWHPPYGNKWVTTWGHWVWNGMIISSVDTTPINKVQLLNKVLTVKSEMRWVVIIYNAQEVVAVKEFNKSSDYQLPPKQVISYIIVLFENGEKFNFSY